MTPISAITTSSRLSLRCLVVIRENNKPRVSPYPRVGRGFTLIELLVVVTAIAILSGVAIVNLNIGNHDDRLRDEARRLFQLTRIAADDAIFKRAQYGIRFTHREYTFYTLQDAPKSSDDQLADKGDTRRWLAINEKYLRAREWSGQIEIEVFVEGLPIALDEVRDAKIEAEQNDLRPHLMFLSNGETLPRVEVYLRSSESTKTWRIGMGEEGRLTLQQLEDS